MNQELQDIIDHMDLPKGDSKELLFRFLLNSLIKIHQNAGLTLRSGDTDLDLVCRQLINSDSLSEAWTRKFYDFDDESRFTEEMKVIGVYAIQDDGILTENVSDPEREAYFLINHDDGWYFLTNGDIWFYVIQYVSEYRIQFSTLVLGNHTRKRMIEAIERFVQHAQ